LLPGDARARLPASLRTTHGLAELVRMQSKWCASPVLRCALSKRLLFALRNFTSCDELNYQGVSLITRSDWRRAVYNDQEVGPIYRYTVEIVSK